MSSSLCDDFLSGLTAVLGGAARPVALHEPEFAGREWELVKDCLYTGWVSSVGKYVDEFEARLAAYTGARHAISVVNGTAALHAALLCAGVDRDDEVLMPTLTFIATANAVAYCGAIPHFIDSRADNLGLDPQALAERLDEIAEPVAGGGWRNRKTGRRLAAVVPMHVFGHPVEMASLLDVCGRYGLPVVEDAAESLGSYIGDRHTGTFGLMGTLSFNGNKTITTGGGGAILTNDPELGKRLKHLTTTARVRHQWEFIHDQVGYNYRMPNLNAALGCAQMERLPEMLTRKHRLAEAYRAAFADFPAFRFVAEPEGCTGNYWLNAVVQANPDRAARDACLQAAADAGFQCRPLWRLMHRLPMYESCPRAPLPIAERLEASLINLPSSAKLAEGAAK